MASPENVGAAPVFSWKTQGGAADRCQTAVRITVQKSGESANVWDSGEVSSDLTTGFRYAGSALASATKYAWQAKTKDASGAWTAAANGTFTTGILADSDWSGASWIEPSSGSTKGVCQFVAAKSVAKAVKEAYWCVTALGMFEAYVNGEPVTAVEPDGSRVRDFLKPGYTKTSVRHAWTYDVTSRLKSGANVLAARVGRGWWSDGIISKNSEDAAAALAFRGQLVIRYADGSSETFCTNTTDWKGRYSNLAGTVPIWLPGESKEIFRLSLGCL